MQKDKHIPLKLFSLKEEALVDIFWVFCGLFFFMAFVSIMQAVVYCLVWEILPKSNYNKGD